MKKISFLMLFALLGIAGISTSLAAQESPESPIGDLFSVSADKQVLFSKGNLQCTINGTDTAWTFAAHQYDMLGTANVNGSALANTIDLFGWSGNTATAKWGISLSIDDNNYSGDFADWGQNIGDGSTWRTLTNDEWTYLRETRANASNLMGVARINLDETGTTYANGLILLPDTWTCPEGITFKSGFSSTNSEQTYADYQTFTLEQWAKLEAAGAVFLPVSGYRNGSWIYDVQNRSYYWSATPNKSFHASYLFFHSRGTERQVRNRCFGQAVRLVQDTYTVTATCDAEQGSVSGAGTYPKGTQVTLTATAAEGYYFLQWSDGKTANPYTFTLTQDTALTAVFAANPVYNAVGGLFSVGEGKQVLFSAGNLQYTQSANVWAFAAHQYDVLGTANVNGSALANTIDLFGWSGNTATAKWGISLSTDNNDYSGDFADWGQNIGNGTTWRTLTHDEWTYLRSGRANAASLMGVARINLDAEGTTYTNGLILLPDTWTCPEGIIFKSGFSSTDDSEQAYADYQTFTLEQWATLEASGAVFLPASGGRSGSSFYDVQHFGYYNSATPYSSGYAYSLYFVSDFAGRTYGNRSYGRAVRLVQDTYTVTATCDAEQGSVSGAGTYPNGTQVTLTATAAEHYHFVQWSDGETANPYTFTLSGDTTITAVFALDRHTVTAGGEHGSVTGAGTYDYGTMVTLTADADEHYHFVQWNNGETANPYTLTLAGDTTINAVFAIDQHTVTAGGENGMVTGTGTYDYGKEVTLEATANAHYHFVQWSNGETANPYTLTLAGDTTINAVFAIDQHTVTAGGEHGSVTGADTYDYSTEVTLEATADEHYHFVQWSNGETANPYTLTLAGDTTINAVFAIDQHTVTVSGEHGSVTGAGTYNYGAQVTLTADADAHYHFVQWSNSETANPYTLTLAGDTTINAVFAIDQHTVTASGENGIVTGTGTYDYGKEVTLEATADEHYHFVQWNNGETANPYTLTLAGDTTITAVFAIDQHTVMASGEHGSVTGAGTYNYGAQVTLTATADAHYLFVQWSNGETTTPYTLTLAGDTALTAVFAIDQHTVTAGGEHGSVTGAGTNDYGTEVTLEATANAHYHFVQWSNGETANPYTLTLAGDTTINAVFAIDQHTVTASGEHGSVTGAGTYNYGAQVTLTADAEEHYHFVQWSDGSWANPYVFSLTQDIDLHAEFEAEPEYKSLSGLFSVSADKHVVFSTGNLQYAQSAEVWSFASEQYKMIGTANVHGNSTSGKIDLFGWSGSTGVAEWGISTSVSNIHYSGTFADWGEVIGDGSEWRTLTSDEWLYLHSGRAHAAQLIGVAGILLNDAGTEYVNGLVLLPDNWQCPDGVSFRSGFANENSADAYGDYQTFDLATWQVLEQSGAVFLPATGFRYGSIVGNAGIIGSYWSGSSYSTTGAYYIDIQSNSVDWYGRQRCYGHAVRLVQDYTGMLYNISATCDADKGRTIGSGMYAEGTVVTIEAIPAVGYIFVRWSDGNTENPRTFLATEEINLYAELAEDKPTQLEPTSSETKARKIIHNGQIFIIRNQVIYDLTGRRIQ